jgi:hypothetical protein
VLVLQPQGMASENPKSEIRKPSHKKVKCNIEHNFCRKTEDVVLIINFLTWHISNTLKNREA